MIPNREDRYEEADYEYNRRQFLKMECGKKRAFLLLGLSIAINILCIICNRKLEIFNKTLVISKLSFVLFDSKPYSIFCFMVTIILFITSFNNNLERIE